MKPSMPGNITVQSNMTDTQVVKMGIKQEVMQHIMTVLTDLYENAPLAVIREYSTNAYDAQTEAGVTRPIEVTLPSAMSPFFRVKDYGVGLSVDDVVDTYAQYGASTKRESNDFNGMLGLGCKSALTYASQFTVTAVKGGVKTQVIISRTEDGTAQAEIVDTCATNDPNGVEVVVPVKRSDSFVREAENFYRWWPEGSVLVNGKEPVRPQMSKVAEGIFMVDGIDTDYIVMGNVAYPCNDRIYKGAGYSTRWGVVAFVNIGEVNFPPSREGLRDDSVTKATIARIKNDFATALEMSVRTDVANAESYADAMKRAQVVKKRFGYYAPKGLTYKGQIVPETFEGKFLVYTTNRARYSVQTDNRFYSENIADSLFITGMNITNGMSARQKEKMRKYAENNGLSVRRFVATDSLNGNVWTAHATFVTYDDVMATSLADPNKPKAVRAKAQAGIYKVWNGACFRDQDLSTLTGTLMYVSPSEKIEDNVFRLMSQAIDDAIIVEIGANRWEKFKRENPGAIHIKAAAKVVVEAAKDVLTDVDRAVMGLDYYAGESVAYLDANRIDDPDVKAYIALTKTSKTNERIDKYNRARIIAGDLGIVFNRVEVISPSNPMRKYPLVSNGGRRDVEDVYLYMNAKYASLNA